MMREPLPHRRSAESFVLEHMASSGKAMAFTVTVGRYLDGRLGEVFVTGAKVGSELEAVARDAAVILSIALQHGVPLEPLANAITREADGRPASVIGSILDRVNSEIPF